MSQPPRTARRLVPWPTAYALIVSVLGAFLVAGGAVAPAHAIPPFPIIDDTDGVPGQTNPNWESVITGTNASGNVYTTDGWLRLTNSSTNQATNILNDIAFPSSTGFQVDFDYRQAGGATHSGDAFPVRTGDGISMYLVDGAAGISAGANGGGLGYSGNTTFCGVTGGYLGVGLDAYGSFSSTTATSAGGPGVSPSTIGVRGSGTPPCVPNAPENYPWVDGATVPGLWTGVTGSRADPASVPDSLYRHVQVTVLPYPGAVQVSVSISELVPKSEAWGTLTPVLTADLSAVPGQTAIPPTLKLGFGASTGGATDFHDIRDIRVAAMTDAVLSSTVTPSTPTNLTLPTGHFLPGDPIDIRLVATNAGPTIIGDRPDGTARVFSDLSALPLSDISWVCAPGPGADCVTPSGTGPVVSADWTGLVGSGVTVDISATIAATAPTGGYSVSAAIPTDFTTNTVGPDGSPVQRDYGATDTDTTNNVAASTFVVDRPDFIQTKSADHAAYAIGQRVTYTLSVSNRGTAPGTADLSDTVPATVSVDSATCTPHGAASCTVSANANVVSGTIVAGPGESATYSITGMAVSNGSATNIATVTPTGAECDGGCGGGPATTASTSIVPTQINLTANALSDGQPVTSLTSGEVIDYSFEVENTGEFVLDDIQVSSVDFSGTGVLPRAVCGETELQPDQSTTCTTSYTVTRQDVDNGFLENSAEAIGNAPGSSVTTRSDIQRIRLEVATTESTPPGVELAQTGEDLVPLLLIGALLFGIGVVVTRSRARRD